MPGEGGCVNGMFEGCLTGLVQNYHVFLSFAQDAMTHVTHFPRQRQVTKVAQNIATAPAPATGRRRRAPKEKYAEPREPWHSELGCSTCYANT